MCRSLVAGLVVVFSLAVPKLSSAISQSNRSSDNPILDSVALVIATDVRDGDLIIDPDKAPDEFERKYPHWWKPKGEGLFPRHMKAKYKKIPCPNGDPGICYMVDIYDCSWGEISCDYRGSVIIRIELRDGFFGMYYYDPDGTLRGFYYITDNEICMSHDGGQNVHCYDRSCFDGVPPDMNPFPPRRTTLNSLECPNYVQ